MQNMAFSMTPPTSCRVLHRHTCQWGQPLCNDIPEALENLGVTQRRWDALAAVYNPIVVQNGHRWMRAKAVFNQGLVCLYGAFVCVLVAVWYLTPDKVMDLATIGPFPLYGLTVLWNVVRLIIRHGWLDKPLQNDVVHALNCSGTWNTIALPVQLELQVEQQTCCHTKSYYLVFLFRPRISGTDENATVATDMSMFDAL